MAKPIDDETEEKEELPIPPAVLKTFPKTVGACVDKLYKMREDRLKLKERMDDIGGIETLLRRHVIERFGEAGLEGAKGSLASCSVSKKTVATVKDWAKFYDYIHKHRAFDMLSRRVNDKAFRERLDSHQPVPGVEPFVVLGLNITKRSNRK